MSKKSAKVTAAPVTVTTFEAGEPVSQVVVAPAALANKGSLPALAAGSVPCAPAKGAARAKGAAPANPMPRSTVLAPVAHAWSLYARMYAEHGVALTRKQATEQAMADGVAYYTARTQYQLWRQAVLAAATAQATSA